MFKSVYKAIVKWGNVSGNWESTTVNKFKIAVSHLPNVDLKESSKKDKIRELAESLQ